MITNVVANPQLVRGRATSLAGLADIERAVVVRPAKVLRRAIGVAQALDATADGLITQQADSQAFLVALAGRDAGIVNARTARSAIAIDHARHARAERAIADFAVATAPRVGTRLERDALAAVAALAFAAVGVLAAADAQLLDRVANGVSRILLAVVGIAAGLLLEALVGSAAMRGMRRTRSAA